MRRSRALNIAAVVVSILVIVAIGAAGIVPLVTGKGLPKVRLLEGVFPESGTAAGRVEVRGELRPNGDVHVTQRVEFPGEGPNTVTIVRPCSQPPYVFGCTTDVTLDGAPVEVTERAARSEISAGKVAEVAYVLHGAVLAHTDVAVLDWPVVPSSFGATPFEDLVLVRGSLELPAPVEAGEVAQIEPHLHAASKERITTVEAAVITFEAHAAPLFNVELDVAFPTSLVPKIPDIRRAGGPGLDSFRLQQSALDQADDVQASTLEATTEPLEVQETVERVVAALALTIPGMLWLIVLVMLILRLRRLAQPLPDTPRYEEEPPSEHDPAVVSVLVSGGKPGPEAVAGAILALANRGDIEMQDLPGEAFRLTVKDTAIGTGADGLLLATLRTLQVEARGHIDAPPLWKRRFGLWASFRKDALRRAEVAGLVEQFVSTRVAIAAIIMTVLGLGALYSPWGPGIFFSFAIPLLIVSIVATLRFGYDLSYPGRILQARWLGYARHLRERTSIDQAPPAGVVVWGPALVYGAVLGVAPEAARLLSPPD